jgi:hypothetical protein
MDRKRKYAPRNRKYCSKSWKTHFKNGKKYKIIERTIRGIECYMYVPVDEK